MDKQKVVVILLVVAILFSLGSIVMSITANTDNLVPAQSTNTVTTIKSDSGNVDIEILPPPAGGSS